jgi:Pup amidohydrolase
MAIAKFNRTFPEIPEYTRRRIFGTEHAFGTVGRKGGIPNFINNGSRICIDSDHIEYCTAETRNPLEEIIYEKAGEIICAPFAEKLYKHNVARNIDQNPEGAEFVSFSAHENYFTKIRPGDLEAVLPFLVTRQIFSGNGKLNPDGSFEISQRSKFTTSVSSGDTIIDRGIVNTRDEPLSKVPGWKRLHHILGDANMCEIAGFLKIGTMGLVLDLLEDGLEPEINYESGTSVSDLWAISKRTSDWYLLGTLDEVTGGIDIQRKYLERAEQYRGRDGMTDMVLDYWGEMLNRCEAGIENLFGWTDWATKKLFMDAYEEKHGTSINNESLFNIDLQYHDTDREKGIFYGLQQEGKIERLITDEMIDRATKIPPGDTRAHFRGNFIRIFNESMNRSIEAKKESKLRAQSDWTVCNLFDYSYNGKSCFSVELNDPLKTYEKDLGLFVWVLRDMGLISGGRKLKKRIRRLRRQ